MIHSKSFLRLTTSILSLLLAVSGLWAQPTNTTVKLTQLETSKTVEGTKAGQIGLTGANGKQRYAQYTEIEPTAVAYVPAASGNTLNISEFVTGSDGNIYYIDWQGRGLRLNTGGGGGVDKNGYYGGNLGNGGDQTIPSVTKSILTNQLTFFRSTDDAGGLVPVRIQVDAGNEPEFLSMKNVSDSLLFSRSDQEFVIHSTNGFNLQSDIMLGLLGDSIQVSGALAANASDHTFLLLRAGNDRLIKKTGIDSTDLNFDALQSLSASGAGPTSYNVDLSGGGGSVTFTEGTNVDLTRSGNNITISATGGGGGGQSLSVVSNTTTLSGGGGSMTINGAGINVATTSGTTITITGTEVDGSVSNEGSLTVGAGTGTTSIINSNTSGSTGVTLTAGTGLSISETGNVITLTNSSPDQTVSIIGAGISVVTGTYPNFTVTSTEVDGSISNEGSLTVGAGTGTTSIINSNTSGSTGVTLTAGTGLSISETGNVITLSSTAGADQTLANTSTSTTHTVTLSSAGGSVQLVEGAGIGLATTGTTLDGIVTVTNSSPDQTVSITGAGISVVTGTYPNFTVTSTEVDGSISNEGSLTVGAGTGTTSIINSNTSGSTGVTLTAGTGLSISETGNVITLSSTAGADQTFANTSTSTTHTVTLSASGGSLTLVEQPGLSISTTGTSLDGIVTFSPADNSATNELQTLANTSTSTTHTITLSNSGGSTQLVEGTGITLATTGTTLDGIVTVTNSAPDQTVSITGAGISVVTGTYPNFTVTSTEVDGAVTNEGSLTVGAGTGSTSIINSNTSGSTGVTLTASTGLSISETGNVITLTNSSPDQTVSITGAGISVVTGTYPNFTVTSTEVDGAVTNEGSLTVGAGTGTTSIINSNTSGSTGVTLTAGTGLSISETGNVITLSSSVTDTKNGYYGGNSGNGGDATIPSVTKSTLTNQLTFYRATDDAGGLVPVRIQVDAGNEPEFLSMKNVSDSLLFSRSDQEFVIHSTNGFNLQSDIMLALIGDSIQVSGALAANASDHTFLLLRAGSDRLIKKTGIDASDLNFNNAQMINDYTASTTYAVPSGAKSLTVICVGGGGGGGSGRKGTSSTARYGGGGGSAGAVTLGSFSISALGSPANITVTVGSGGAGGAAQTTNNSSGLVGTAGGETSLSISGAKFIVAGGGNPGVGGTGSAGTAGALQDIGDFASKAGSNGGLPNATSVTSSPNKAAGSGAGGGGITTVEATGTGGTGGSGYHGLNAGGTGGTSGGGAGGAGNAPSGDQYTGGGGGGGGSSTTVAAGAGGAGGRGGGGGGGGAGTDSVSNSGAGGAGGGGWIRIIANF